MSTSNNFLLAIICIDASALITQLGTTLYSSYIFLGWKRHKNGGRFYDSLLTISMWLALMFMICRTATNAVIHEISVLGYSSSNLTSFIPDTSYNQWLTTNAPITLSRATFVATSFTVWLAMNRLYRRLVGKSAVFVKDYADIVSWLLVDIRGILFLLAVAIAIVVADFYYLFKQGQNFTYGGIEFGSTGGYIGPYIDLAYDICFFVGIHILGMRMRVKFGANFRGGFDRSSKWIPPTSRQDLKDLDGERAELLRNYFTSAFLAVPWITLILGVVSNPYGGLSATKVLMAFQVSLSTNDIIAAIVGEVSVLCLAVLLILTLRAIVSAREALPGVFLDNERYKGWSMVEEQRALKEEEEREDTLRREKARRDKRELGASSTGVSASWGAFGDSSEQNTPPPLPNQQQLEKQRSHEVVDMIPSYSGAYAQDSKPPIVYNDQYQAPNYGDQEAYPAAIPQQQPVELDEWNKLLGPNNVPPAPPLPHN